MARKKQKEKSSARRMAAIYCRVSSFDQGQGDYSSLEEQEERLGRAVSDEGYKIFRVYKEIASSASMERDQLKRMLSELNRFDAVFVTKLDRLSRSMRDWVTINEQMDKNNVVLVAVTQKIDTSTVMGRFFRDLLMLFAQFEREMIAERTYEKMTAQAKKGRWGGGYSVLGYDVRDKKLVVNKTEAKLVLAIFRKYLELGSLAKTARWANSKGYRTKARTFTTGRKVAARRFTRADIQRLLTNIHYVGKVRFDGVDYPGEHDAIVPMEVFIEVQRLMEARSEKPRRADQKQQDTLLLGLLRCGYCGGAYTSSFVNKKTKKGKTKRYYYYRCTSKTKRDADACKGADLRADVVDAAFVGFFRKLAQEPDKLQAMLSAAEKASKEGCGAIEKERAKAVRALSQVDRQASALVDRLADPELKDLAAVKNRLKELEVQQKELQAAISELTLQLRDRRDEVISLDEVKAAYEEFDELWDELSFQEKQYAVRLLVQEVRVRFEKGKEKGQLAIKAWGRRPTRLSIRLQDFRKRKLRNQDGWLPGEDSNLQPSD